MALFDSHKKFVRCREKGVDDDPCVKKLDCQICKAFTPAQIQQLSTSTYKSRKEREQMKTVTDYQCYAHSHGPIRGYSFGMGTQ